MTDYRASLPLRTVSQLTGLSPDLLRAWERRYQVVSPRRGPRGARLYTREQVDHLRLLAEVVATGRSIGDVAKLDREALQRIAGEAAAREQRSRAERPEVSADVVTAALDSIEAFDPDALQRVLSDALLALGAMGFVQRVAAPLLVEVGDRWSRGELTVADEHLTSGVLRNLLSSLLHTRGRGHGVRLLMSTPAGERHELGTLITSLVAADAGLDVVYLGPDMPALEIADAADRCDAKVVALGVVLADNRENATAEVRALAAKLPITTELWLGGPEAEAVAAAATVGAVITVPSFDAARAEVVRLRAESTRAQ